MKISKERFIQIIEESFTEAVKEYSERIELIQKINGNNFSKVRFEFFSREDRDI